MGNLSPWLDASNRHQPGATRTYGPSAWTEHTYIDPAHRTALQRTKMITDALSGLFNGQGGGAWGANSGASGGPGAIGGWNFMDAGGNRVGGVSLSGAIQSPIQANPGSVWSDQHARDARSGLMGAARGIGGQYGDMATGMANRLSTGLNLAGQQGEADWFNRAQTARGQSHVAAQRLMNQLQSVYQRNQLAQSGLNNSDQLMALRLLGGMLGAV